MREFELITALRRLPCEGAGVHTGLGDDCAVVELGAGLVLLKVDACVEGRHFLRSGPDALSLELIGRKAMARNLSDIAAMGGIARFALVAAQLPAGMSQEEALRLDRGLREVAASFDVAVVGGDTTLAVAGISLTISLIGEMQGVAPVLRSGAQIGDVIAATGAFGGSRLGHHARFEPRLVEGRWLAKAGVTSMIDVSDGLAADLAHLCRESGTGATLVAGQIPLSEAAQAMAREDGRSALEHALRDGEDFELIFTLAAQEWPALLQAWPFPTPLTAIGQMCAPKPHLIDILGTDANPTPLPLQGFEHAFD